MALSNHERVGRGFTSMGIGLDEFLTRVLAPELNGVPWVDLLRTVDKARGNAKGKYEPTDPQCSLRLLTENVTGRIKTGWFPLNSAVGHGQQALASELRDTRNSWAHAMSQGFTNDDAYRALDSMSRLLRACGQPVQADEVDIHRREVQRLAAEKNDRAVSRKAGLAEAIGDNLPSWRTVLEPHPDVATGNFHAAQFAADLHEVAAGRAGSEYGEPVPFFERTYLTEGLKDLLLRAARRLGGDPGASPVINLQTTFGGGKTHSMLAVWHLASGTPILQLPQDLRDLLAGHDLPTGARRVAIVGNHLQAGAPNIMEDGTVCHTLWGVLAWRLGGPEGYAMVADADRTHTNPGGKLRDLFERFGPAVVLIDEWVAYARELYGRDDLPGGTFDTQFTFAQTLTEAAKAVPGVLVLVSIPASAEMNEGEFVTNDEEVGGQNGRETLHRLQRVVARVADQWRPADADESFEIVRRRLFVSPDRAALGTISGVAKAMVGYYRKNNTVFPKDAQGTDYEKRIRDCYPIHPELFDRLYADWSTLPRFQRTRGVLRLMNEIVHALWASDSEAPFIMPGNVPLADDRVSAELTQYLDDAWKAIIATDVDGPGAVPTKVDSDSPVYGKRHTARRLARTVFLGATPTLHGAQKGIDRSRVFLGTALPGDTPGNFHSALESVADRATYFYSGGTAYWYDTQANTSRAAADHAAGLSIEDVWAEIERRLRAHQTTRPDGFAAVHIAPGGPADVPDQDQVRLVLVPPKYTNANKKADGTAGEYVTKVLASKGAGARTHRNMLLFLAADAKRNAELESSTRKYLAWRHIVDAADTAFDLTASQKKQAIERAAQADDTVTQQLWSAYVWLLYPESIPGQQQTLAAEKADGKGSTLAERAAERARNDSLLSVGIAHSLIDMDLNGPLKSAWSDGEITVGQLWGYYTQYPYLKRLRDRDVLVKGLLSHADVLDAGFALAEAKDAEKYLGLVMPEDPQRPTVLADNALIVKIARARAQREQELRDRHTVDVPDGDDDESKNRDTDGSGSDNIGPGDNPDTVRPRPDPDPTTPPGPQKPRRYYASFDVPTDRPSGQIKDILNEIADNLRRQPGAIVRVTLDVEATAPGGFDEAVVRTVRENTTTLKLDGEFE